MTSPISVTRRLRSTKRAAEVVAVLARNGLHQAVIESGVADLLEHGRDLISRSRPERKVEAISIEARVRMTLEQLGPTFIKLGQVLSTRPDLIPPDWVAELRKLQDDCPRVEFSEIRERLEEELGEELGTLFESIDEVPLAAASMAQVHRARWADGSDVVVKVLRPGIQALIKADMDVLMELARLTEKYFQELGYSPTEVVREFSRELEREVDLAHEGKSTDRLRKYFEDEPGILFPRVYWDATTSAVLTMEYIEGRLLSSVPPETLTKEQRETIVARGADAVFRMCLEFGFFHADPHPGNIIIMEGERVCFIDCGMTGRVEQRTTLQLARLVNQVINGDVDGVIQSAIALSDADSSLKTDRALRRDVWDFLSRFQDATLEGLDVPALLDDFFEILRQHHVRCPADLVFLIKALSTIQGVGQQYAPDFDLVAFARPHLEKLVRSRYSFAATKQRIQDSLVQYAELVEELPGEVRDVFDQIRRREFTVHLQHHGVDRLNDDSIEHASRNMASAMVMAGLCVASSVLILADSLRNEATILNELGMLGLVCAALLGLAFVFSAWRRRKRR